MALSDKHRMFCEEYLSTWNATEAYSRVYPKASRETARRNGSVLLTNTDIAAEIKRRVAERTMSADEALVRLAEQARAEYSNYLTRAGTVDVDRMVADGKAHLIKAIKETRFARNIEFHDAQAALVQIAKINGLLTDKTEHSGEMVLRVIYGDEGTGDSPAETA